MRRILFLLGAGVAIGALVWFLRRGEPPASPRPDSPVASRADAGESPSGAERRRLRRLPRNVPAEKAPWLKPEREQARDRRDQLLRKLSKAERTRIEALVKAKIAAQDRGEKVPDGLRGTLDKDYIQKKIGEIKPLMKECYELGLANKPDLAGRLVVKFVIVADPDHGGLVERAEVVRSARDGGPADLDDPMVHECVRETVQSIIFDPPKNGGRVTVRYPFVFAQKDGGAGADAAAPPAAPADGGEAPAAAPEAPAAPAAP